MRHSIKKSKALGVSLLFSTIFIIAPTSVQAQLMDQPWGFNGQNRASIAALMKQVEDQSGASSIVSSGSGDITSLVCGGEGDSTAKANSSCIILNNSDADIYIGQDAEGDQTATNEETTNVDETINTNVEAIDDVLDTLSGESEDTTS